MTPGPVPGTGVLDAGPPPPGPMGNAPNPSGPTGGQYPTLSSFAGPAQMTSAQIPPEILTGMLQAGEKISSVFDAFAQVTPDLAADWDILKDLLQRTLGKVMVAGGGATSPTAPGTQFPGGGINQGTP